MPKAIGTPGCAIRGLDTQLCVYPGLNVEKRGFAWVGSKESRE